MPVPQVPARRGGVGMPVMPGCYQCGTMVRTMAVRRNRSHKAVAGGEQQGGNNSGYDKLGVHNEVIVS